jgi:hypothetical protein
VLAEVQISQLMQPLLPHTERNALLLFRLTISLKQSACHLIYFLIINEIDAINRFRRVAPHHYGAVCIVKKQQMHLLRASNPDSLDRPRRVGLW